MKRLLPLLLLLLVLTGCASQTGSVTLPQENNIVSAFSAEEITQLKHDAVHPYVLLENAQTTDGILYSIQTEAMEDMDFAGMTAFQDSILLHCQKWSQEGGAQLLLATMDLKDGSALSQTTLDISGFVQPQAMEDQLVISDSQTGLVRILDADLQVTREHTLTPDFNHWYMSTDGQQMYQIGWYDGIKVTDLASGTTQELSLPVLDLFFCDSDPEQLTLNYVDLATQMQTTGYLDLASGAMVTIPFDVPATQATHSGEMWLAMDFYDTYTYYLGSTASTDVVHLPQGDELRLLNPHAHLLRIGRDKTLTLYDRNGTFLSSCVTGFGEEIFIESDFIWSEQYGGYFFLATHPEQGSQLCFWDINVPTQGEDLALTAWSDGTTVAPGTAVDASLYERAARMSEEYGVVIRIADQCATVFDSFESTHLTEEYWVEYALDNLEEALGSYPEGFFDQLRFDSVRYVEIQLVGSLTAIDDEWKTASYSAFASQQHEKYLVVMDSYQATTNNYYHEFSHIIDKKLSWDAYCRSDALYSEEHWRSLSPDHANYSYTYTDWPDISTDDLTSYFVDSYSRTYPTEDRARIMEYAMMDWFYGWENSAGIREKLDYYCRCIRDCFDTETWPEVTLWEQPLNDQ